jgi:hypothetical protein
MLEPKQQVDRAIEELVANEWEAVAGGGSDYVMPRPDNP